MTLDNIKNQTTWSDAAASLNKNFAKLKAAIGTGGTGGGGSIDPELLEGFIPLQRQFSDDFNNDFAR